MELRFDTLVIKQIHDSIHFHSSRFTILFTSIQADSRFCSLPFKQIHDSIHLISCRFTILFTSIQADSDFGILVVRIFAVRHTCGQANPGIIRVVVRQTELKKFSSYDLQSFAFRTSLSLLLELLRTVTPCFLPAMGF